MNQTVLTVALASIAWFGLPALAQTPQTAIPCVIAGGARVGLVRDGYRALEGPVATPDGGLLFSDVDAERAYKLAADGSIAVWRESTNRASRAPSCLRIRRRPRPRV